MTNDELILKKLTEINDRLTRIEVKQDEQTETLCKHTEILNEHTEMLAEHTEILAEHTAALNTLIEWADNVQTVVQIPFAKTENI